MKLLWYIHRRNSIFPKLHHYQNVRISTSCHYSSSSGEQQPNENFRQKIKNAWNGPNFKYWFIGVTGFTAWMGYYGMKNYKKKCLDIELLPSLPNHYIVERDQDVKDLQAIYENQLSFFDRNNVKLIEISGVSGSGKTLLFNNFLNKLKSSDEGRFKLPSSNITVFLNADSDVSFLQSLKTFAAKLKINRSDFEEKLEPNQSFFLLPINEQCDIILECIQETTNKHSGWIICIDNIQSTTSIQIKQLISKWFIDGDNKRNWSSGTLFLICDGKSDVNLKIPKDQKYRMKAGLSQEDALSFLHNIVNIDSNNSNAEKMSKLIDRVYSNPLGILCVGILLKDKLSQKETISINDAVDSLVETLDVNVKNVVRENNHLKDFIQTYSGLKLLVLQTSIAMAMECSLKDNIYLQHGFDFIASLKPSTVLTQNLLNRHLMHSFYKLPLLGEKSPGILDVLRSDKNQQETKINELEPKGKLWSNKNLAEYVKKVEDFFIMCWTTVKEIYNLIYGELPPLPQRNDGLDMFRSCALLSTGCFHRGEGKTFIMHPLVYNVARQRYLASTIHSFESKILDESRANYDMQPWYKRLSGFSDQACLHQYRSLSVDKETLNKKVNNTDSFLFRYNMGIDVSSVFRKDDSIKLVEFYNPSDGDKLHYLQAHLSRVVDSIKKEIKVSKDDPSARFVKENALEHLEYIINNQPMELLELKTQINALQVLANMYSKLLGKNEESKQILQRALHIQQESITTDPLDLAKTMTQIAEIHNVFNETEKAKTILLDAAEIYEKDRRKHGEYKQPFEFGTLLGLLGVVYGTLGMKQESKETVERSLMLLQAQPPDMKDEAATKKFGADFASALTDLGHSYVSLGLPLYGKKILDLALVAHRNIHGENHSEVVRTLTVLGIAHLMQGHNEESKKLRSEAGKIQQAINLLPSY